MAIGIFEFTKLRLGFRSQLRVKASYGMWTSFIDMMLTTVSLLLFYSRYKVQHKVMASKAVLLYAAPLSLLGRNSTLAGQA